MSRRPLSATLSTTVPDAASLMLQHNISCLPIVDQNLHPIGIVTSRDLLRALVGEGG
jgi:acetoin utilization protein AcuB